MFRQYYSNESGSIAVYINIRCIYTSRIGLYCFWSND